MSKVRVNAFGIAIDGYGAGPDQDLANPMGIGGMALHQWVFGTKTFQKMAADFDGSLIGDEVGREGVDDDFAARGFENIGAWINDRLALRLCAELTRGTAKGLPNNEFYKSVRRPICQLGSSV